MNIAIVGATGLVGRTMIRVLEERETPLTSLTLLASARSVGQVIQYNGVDHLVRELTPESFVGVDVALFSAGGALSKIYAPIAAKSGCVVIDNSSAWRMDPDVPLVVPEVNAADALLNKGIIANPNCSTIQMVVALKPISDVFGLKRVVVSTYQSPSGAGQRGLDQLQSEVRGQEPTSRITQHRLAENAVFHTIDGLGEASEEETKMIRETRRIMHLPELRMAVTCVRVPVLGGHGEAVVVETLKSCTDVDVRALLSATPGIVVMDDPAGAVYPTPFVSNNTDPVYVGRIRNDDSVENGVMLWVVADNLRKGAATNAVQILEYLMAEQ
ncbi:MAG: aspartate-semialdehyde dehydrogenase [Candidatus Kapabacteria bacterium]|nr:aspartate-semialdehyde dehydrogenase [Candidatus Kapabacteria bacterium]